jgi:hypothetical protein
MGSGDWKVWMEWNMMNGVAIILISEHADVLHFLALGGSESDFEKA